MNVLKKAAALCAALVVLGSPAVLSAGPVGPPTGLTVEILEPSDLQGTYGARLSWSHEIRDAAFTYKIYFKQVSFGDGGDCNPVGCAQYALLGETNGFEYVVTSDRLDVASKAYAFYVVAVGMGAISEPSNIVSTVCGRPYNDGDITKYTGDGSTTFVSDPPTSIGLGDEYAYDASIIAELSAERPSISYELVRGPEEMELNEQTGKITWMPETHGQYVVVLQATVNGAEMGRQTWTIDVNASVSSVGADDATASVAIYPNPASSTLALRFPAAGKSASLTVRDALGREVLATSTPTVAGSTTANLDVSSLTEGRYFVQIVEGDRTLTLPFTVTR